MGANDALFLGFRKHIHNAFEALGPITFGQAVHEANVDMIGVEFAAETLEIIASSGRIARPRLGEHRDFITRDMFERFGHVRMAAVGIGGIEEAQAMVVAVEEHVGKALDAEGSLVGMMAAADSAGAHGEAAGLDARLAESYSIRSAELVRESRKGKCGPSKG